MGTYNLGNNVVNKTSSAYNNTPNNAASNNYNTNTLGTTPFSVSNNSSSTSPSVESPDRTQSQDFWGTDSKSLFGRSLVNPAPTAISGGATVDPTSNKSSLLHTSNYKNALQNNNSYSDKSSLGTKPNFFEDSSSVTNRISL